MSTQILKNGFSLKNLLLIAITFAFANVFTFAAEDVEIAQADITRMLGNSHQTAPYDFNYTVDDNGAIHYTFKEINSTNAHNTYRIYANGELIHEGVGAVEGAFTPEPNSGDIKLTVSQQVDNKGEYINVNVTVPEHAVFQSPLFNAEICSPCPPGRWEKDTLIIRMGSVNTFYNCPITYIYRYRSCGDKIEIEGLSYALDINNPICNWMDAFIDSECWRGTPAADGELEYAKWLLTTPCFWFKLYELAADAIGKEFYDGVISASGSNLLANSILSCNATSSRKMTVAYYSGGCSAMVAYSYRNNLGNDIVEVKPLASCSISGDIINCCMRSRTYCIPAGSGSKYVGPPKPEIKHEVVNPGAIVECSPNPPYFNPNTLPLNTTWYFVGECNQVMCE